MLGKLVKWGLSALRLALFKLRLGKRLTLGRRVYLGKRCTLRASREGKIVLGDGVYLSEGCTLQADGPGKILVGKDSFFNTFCRIYAMERVTVGENCLFGSNVSLYDHDHDLSHGVKNAGARFLTAAVTVEDAVWLCTNVVVTRGSRVGGNSAVAAGSVVCGSLPENGLYAGAPAVRKKAVPPNAD